MFGLFKKAKPFSSNNYWETRYKDGGNSGAGSYNHLATFKAEVINQLVTDNSISSVIEFGCGDGNQLSLLKFDRYTGLDVSASALSICKNKFLKDNGKSFFLYDHTCFVDNHHLFRHDCSMSLDVLYHLVETNVYEDYLLHLFNSASRMVIIYAANVSLPQNTSHELYREFTKDVERLIPGWKLDKFIKNKYPAAQYEEQENSLADFFVYTPSK